MEGLAHILLSWPVYVVATLLVTAMAAWFSARGSNWHRARHFLGLTAVLAYIGSTPFVSNLATLSLETQFERPTVTAPAPGQEDLIVVLTGGWFHRQPQGYVAKIGNDGWERLDAAIRLWQQIGGRMLISGAPSPDGRDSVARVMGEVAERNGVPRSAILLEQRSTNTYENLEFSASMMTTVTGRTWLVTSANHMPRAMAVARRLGLSLVPYPCDFRGERRGSWRAFVPANHAPLALEKALHEIIGLMVYRWRGWA